MEARVVLIRHNDSPADDRVVSFLRMRGVEPEFRHPFRGEPLGSPDESVAVCVLYGGPFNVLETERHPFLKDEHRWVEGCMKQGIPLLGICQGAQSIAHVLGAHVGPKPDEPHEFGYYPIWPTEAGAAFFPAELHVAQSHFHEFHIPSGAEHLAASDAFSNQAMKYGESTFAFQFHPEVTPAGFRRWQARSDGYAGKQGAQEPAEQDRLGAIHDARQHDWFMGFLEQFLGQRLPAAALSA
jgi:GMP synthase (glutamine-hydrolysing)